MHKILGRLAALAAAAALLAGCAGAGEKGGSAADERPAVQSAELQFQAPEAGDPIAIFDTSAGQFRAVLYPDEAPQTCDNFIGLAEAGYYNGLTFTRTEPGFVVEAGQTADGRVTTIWNGNGMPAETTDALHHYSGALCAALAEDGMAYSVFYLMQTPPGPLEQELTDQMTAQSWRQEVIDAYQAAGGAPYLDYTDTVFGQVYEGMEVVDAIAESGAAAADGETAQAVTLNSVTISTYQPAAQGQTQE